MPLGTKEISESSRELAKILSSYSDSMKALYEATETLSKQTSSFALEMSGFAEKMDEMTKEMREMHRSMDRLNNTFEIQMTQLNKNLQQFGQYFTQSMMENVKESLDPRKIIPGFLKHKD